MERKTIWPVVVLCAGMLVAVAAFGASEGQDGILGEWNNAENTARIDVYRCGEAYCGKIVWLKEPDYPADSEDGIPGTPKLDHNNPDPSLRKNALLGLEIVRDFRAAGENRWTGGTVYDPKNGKTYKGKMTLVGTDRLELRGYIGIPLIGRTSTWTR